MTLLQHIPKTELARHTRQVIQTAQRGQTVVIESHGQPEVAIMDILDYYIVRAVLNYHAQPPAINPEHGLSDQKVSEMGSVQEKYNLVLAHYLEESISLSRAAELLKLSWLDMRSRFIQLNVPLRTAPSDSDELQSDITNLDGLYTSKRARE